MTGTEFHNLYQQYAADVFRFAWCLIGDRSLAEDVTSETFVRAWTAPGEIHTETVKAWLFAIAREPLREPLAENGAGRDVTFFMLRDAPAVAASFAAVAVVLWTAYYRLNQRVRSTGL